jgi:hypothetical protein
MSAMETMAKNILASMIPPQVMAMITSENMEAIMMRAKAFVEQQDRIEKMLEEIINDRRNGNSGGRQRRIGTGGPAAGSDGIATDR